MAILVSSSARDALVFLAGLQATGEHGWVASLAFAAWALSSWALAFELWPRAHGSRRRGGACLAPGARIEASYVRLEGMLAIQYGSGLGRGSMC
ncbi:MAG TPA: hypothetical protein VFA04_05430 [Bryobacteraceae bacterium]|nr:hypothetical protein [Bryobacteraceae bacterium]